MTPKARRTPEARKARGDAQEKKHAAWRKLPQKEQDAAIAEKLERSAEQNKEQGVERRRERAKRDTLRSWLNSIKGVKYFHVRQNKTLMRLRMPNRKIGMGLGTPSQGGICVVTMWNGKTLSIGVSVCARDDVYDKLEARKHAVERLLKAADDDPLGKIVIRFVGGGMKLKGFLPTVVNLVAHNAVALLGKRVDREWFQQKVL